MDMTGVDVQVQQIFLPTSLGNNLNLKWKSALVKDVFRYWEAKNKLDREDRLLQEAKKREENMKKSEEKQDKPKAKKKKKLKKKKT